MAKIDIKKTENPKLMQKKLSDGRLSLYLEYYLGYSKEYDEAKDKEVIKKARKREYLSLYLLDNPRTPIERQSNEQTIEIAKEIRWEREQALKKDKTGKRLYKTKNINFLEAFQNYIDGYSKKDIRMMEGVLQRFKDFLKLEYPVYHKNIKPDQISKDMVIEFVEYLESRSKGEGAKGYYQRFKKFILYAIDHDLMVKNPSHGVVCKVDTNALRKDILSMEEIQKLVKTTYAGQNPNVRKAFIFCLYTGIRFCDVVELKYSNVDYSNKLLNFEQVKTKGHSSNSGVLIPLNDGLISLIGDQPINPNGFPVDKNIFDLPSHTMCLKALDRWTKRAGINKHITWHCARHSFAVNILNYGANIKTVSSLLGHSGLQHTEKYTRAVDELKKAAINSLPELNY
jgi:integrase/recombinase XerD